MHYHPSYTQSLIRKGTNDFNKGCLCVENLNVMNISTDKLTWVFERIDKEWPVRVRLDV